jgi:hypothetical protein
MQYLTTKGDEDETSGATIAATCDSDSDSDNDVML